MARKTAYFGVMIAFSMILSYIESLVPIYFGAPGIKLGLANFIVVLILYQQGAREAILINGIRILLTGFLFGSLFSILYSLSGGLISFLCMVILKKTRLFSMIGISIVGGITHNLGQLFIAMYVVKTAGIIYYAPILIIGGMITGSLIGIIARLVLQRIPGNGVTVR